MRKSSGRTRTRPLRPLRLFPPPKRLPWRCGAQRRDEAEPPMPRRAGALADRTAAASRNLRGARLPVGRRSRSRRTARCDLRQQRLRDRGLRGSEHHVFERLRRLVVGVGFVRIAVLLQTQAPTAAPPRPRNRSPQGSASRAALESGSPPARRRDPRRGRARRAPRLRGRRGAQRAARGATRPQAQLRRRPAPR